MEVGGGSSSGGSGGVSSGCCGKKYHPRIGRMAYRFRPQISMNTHGGGGGAGCFRFPLIERERLGGGEYWDCVGTIFGTSRMTARSASSFCLGTDTIYTPSTSTCTMRTLYTVVAVVFDFIWRRPIR